MAELISKNLQLEPIITSDDKDFAWSVHSPLAKNRTAKKFRNKEDAINYISQLKFPFTLTVFDDSGKELYKIKRVNNNIDVVFTKDSKEVKAEFAKYDFVKVEAAPVELPNKVKNKQIEEKTQTYVEGFKSKIQQLQEDSEKETTLVDESIREKVKSEKLKDKEDISKEIALHAKELEKKQKELDKLINSSKSSLSKQFRKKVELLEKDYEEAKAELERQRKKDEDAYAKDLQRAKKEENLKLTRAEKDYARKAVEYQRDLDKQIAAIKSEMKTYKRDLNKRISQAKSDHENDIKDAYKQSKIDTSEANKEKKQQLSVIKSEHNVLKTEFNQFKDQKAQEFAKVIEGLNNKLKQIDDKLKHDLNNLRREQELYEIQTSRMIEETEQKIEVMKINYDKVTTRINEAQKRREIKEAAKTEAKELNKRYRRMELMIDRTADGSYKWVLRTNKKYRFLTFQETFDNKSQAFNYINQMNDVPHKIIVHDLGGNAIYTIKYSVEKNVRFIIPVKRKTYDLNVKHEIEFLANKVLLTNSANTYIVDKNNTVALWSMVTAIGMFLAIATVALTKLI